MHMNLAVEQRVQLRHDSSLNHVNGVNAPRVLGNDGGLVKASARELIKVVARLNGKVHFRRHHRGCAFRKSDNLLIA